MKFGHLGPGSHVARPLGDVPTITMVTIKAWTEVFSRPSPRMNHKVKWATCWPRTKNGWFVFFSLRRFIIYTILIYLYLWTCVFSLVLKVFIPMLNGENQTASFLDTCCLMVSLQTTSPKTPQVKEVNILFFWIEVLMKWLCKNRSFYKSSKLILQSMDVTENGLTGFGKLLVLYVINSRIFCCHLST